MKKLLILFVFFLSCQNSNNKEIIDIEFKEILLEYSNKYPISNLKNFGKGEIFPVPSYQVFFDKFNNDTIISIKLSPFIVGLNPINFEFNKENDSIAYEFIQPEGFFLLRNKTVFIFDEDNYSKNLLKKDKLITNIPDSLKWNFDYVNTHINSHSEYYKLTKSSIKKIDL